MKGLAKRLSLLVYTSVFVCFHWWPVACVANGYFPLDMDETDFYLTTRKGGPPSAVIEDLKRGQEGVLVKLMTISKKIDDDELKLNNIFYKIGHHDTKLDGVDDKISRLGKSNKRNEAKLNRHAFNVEFLGRQVKDVQNNVRSTLKDKEKINSLQATVDHLEERLSEAFYRVDTLEKKTNEQPIAGRLLNAQYAMSPSALSFYPNDDNKAACRRGWLVMGSECLYLSKDRKSFADAMSSCVADRSVLSSLSELNHKETNTILGSGNRYWTSATNLFATGNRWVYLLSGKNVVETDWLKSNSKAGHKKHCATITKDGLEPAKCNSVSLYICRIL